MEASASAKIILLGEHAVVYGKPAIAIPVSGLRATVSVEENQIPGQGLQVIVADLNQQFGVSGLENSASQNPLEKTVEYILKFLQASPPNVTVTIRSDIPIASGLGSGAAVSTALARAIILALNQPLDRTCLNEIIYEVEKIHHGTPSGIDNTVVVYECPVYFIRNHPIQMISIAEPFTFIIADTGKSALTRVAVGDVRELYNSNPSGIQWILDKIEELVLKARQAIESGELAELGALMTANHSLLQELTVSSPELDKLVQAALDGGALGAKLSGGGRGGNMIALVTPDTTASVREKLLEAGATRVFETTVN